MDRIYLVGFMGAGKTEVGKSLAKALQYDFVDLDDRVEQRLGLSIKEIFELYGEEDFRVVESSALFQLKDSTRIVLATGGGTPCYNRNMNFIKRTGFSIYLKIEPDFLVKRLLYEKHKRPLIQPFEKKELLTYISKKLKERQVYYEQCHLAVPANVPVRDVVKSIIASLGIENS